MTEGGGCGIKRVLATTLLVTILAVPAMADRTANGDSGPPSIIPNIPPVAGFTWTPSTPAEGSVVQFIDLSIDPENSIISWFWQFGDGDTSSLSEPTHAYGDDGPYQVTLTVLDAEGFQDSITQTLDTTNIIPEVHVNTPLIFTLTQGSMTVAIPPIERAEDVVSFYNYSSASSHTGFEKGYESKVFLYRDTTINALHLLFTHGIDDGPSPRSEVSLDLSGIPPGAYVSQSDDPSHCWNPPRCEEFSLAYPALEGQWMYTYNTDGGILSGLPVNGPWCITITPQHWFAIDRWVYHFANGDAIDLDMNNPVTICHSPPPTSSQAINIDEGDQAVLSGFFDDPGWEDDFVVAAWAFGEGTTEPAVFSPGIGFSHHDVDPVFHSYGDDGTYSACLVVQDDDNGLDFHCADVAVGNVAPTIDSLASETVNKGEAAVFGAQATDPGSDDLIFTWDWGDGSPNNVSVYRNNGVSQDLPMSPDGIYPFSAIDEVSHIYENMGPYVVTLKVVDDDGGETVLVSTINVVAPDLIPWDIQVNGNVYVAPVSIALGSDLVISAKARNLGTGNATNLFHLSVTDSMVSQSMGIHRLNSGSTSIGTLTLIWTASSPGAYQFEVMVDSWDSIEELNEDNNRRFLEIIVRGPDLIPDEIQIDEQEYITPVEIETGDTLTISVLASNVGEHSTGRPCTIAFYNAADSTNAYYKEEIPELGVGDSSGRIFMEWIAPPIQGEYSIVIEVDYLQEIPELDERNNTAIVLVNVEAMAPLPLALKSETNYKPLIALIFTLILVILGGLGANRRPLDIFIPPREGEDAEIEMRLLRKKTIEEKLLILEEEELFSKFSRDRLLTTLLVALPFTIAEMAIGLVSFTTGLLRVPESGNWLSFGLVVNVIVLLLGIAYAALISRKGYSVPDEKKLASLKEDFDSSTQ